MTEKDFTIACPIDGHECFLDGCIGGHLDCTRIARIACFGLRQVRETTEESGTIDIIKKFAEDFGIDQEAFVNYVKELSKMK